MERREQGLSVGELSRLFGVSVRTLRYYDGIGLLRPKRRGADYRVYDADDIALLQEILFYRELELPLSEIRRILDDPAHDRAQTLEKHRALLKAKQAHLSQLLTLVDATLKGETVMTKERSKAADYAAEKERYRDEVQARWGGTDAFRESEKKDAARTDAEKDLVQRDMEAIFTAFAAARTGDPAGAEAQALVKRWQAHITANYYRCTDEILSGLAEMYTGDERFAATLDAYGAGTAQFMHDAIKAYCKA